MAARPGVLYASSPEALGRTSHPVRHGSASVREVVADFKDTLLSQKEARPA
jgi:hypothetical protein